MVQSEKIIEENELFFQGFGADLQAGIFASPRKEHLLLLFLHLQDGQDLANLRLMLRSMATNSRSRRGLYLTSLQNQNDNYREKKEKNALFFNVFLSAAGLKKLGGEGAAWQAVLQNLEAHEDDLAGNGLWDAAYQSKDSVDLVLHLGHQQKDALLRIRRQFEKELFPRMQLQVLFAEEGQVFREISRQDQDKSIVVEHFGYADGGSNPCVAAWEFEKYRQQQRTMAHWNPVTSYRHFVVEEPSADRQPGYGSFLVYRKFEQHLQKFKKAIQDLAGKKGISEEEAGALAFGRRKDGTPLEDQGTGGHPDNNNDFVYTAESKCPVFSHIRKINPRHAPEGEDLPRVFGHPNPIMRRGITYGKRKLLYGRFSPMAPPSDPVGLLFLSFQDDIGRYQHLLRSGQEEVADPILSNLDQSAVTTAYHFPDLEEPIRGFGGFTSLRGGLNLYAPSLKFFKQF